MEDGYEDIIHNGRVVGKRRVLVISEPAKETDIDRDDFIERFTPQEWLAGQQAAQQNPVLSQAFSLLMAKPDGKINLSSPRLAPVFQAMVKARVLTEDRAR